MDKDMREQLDTFKSVLTGKVTYNWVLKILKKPIL